MQMFVPRRAPGRSKHTVLSSSTVPPRAESRDQGIVHGSAKPSHVVQQQGPVAIEPAGEDLFFERHLDVEVRLEEIGVSVGHQQVVSGLEAVGRQRDEQTDILLRRRLMPSVGRLPAFK